MKIIIEDQKKRFKIISEDENVVLNIAKISKKDYEDIYKSVENKKVELGNLIKTMRKTKNFCAEMSLGFQLEKERLCISKFEIEIDPKNKNKTVLIVLTYFSEVESDEYLDFINEHKDKSKGFKSL